jgi:hypothetical protein
MAKWLHEVLAPGYSLRDQLAKLCKKTHTATKLDCGGSHDDEKRLSGCRIITLKRAEGAAPPQAP